MAGHTQNRRKQIIINRPMQSRLVLHMALIPAICLTAIAAFTGLYCSRLMDDAMAVDSDLPDLAPLFYLVIAFQLLAGVFLLFNSLKISHRVAGPAYRICKSLERIRAGDLAFTVNLRKGDHLTEVRDELNRLLDWLNENPPAGCVTRQMRAATGAQDPAQAPAQAGAGAGAAAQAATEALQTAAAPTPDAGD